MLTPASVSLTGLYVAVLFIIYSLTYVPIYVYFLLVYVFRLVNLFSTSGIYISQNCFVHCSPIYIFLFTVSMFIYFVHCSSLYWLPCRSIPVIPRGHAHLALLVGESGLYKAFIFSCSNFLIFLLLLCLPLFSLSFTSLL